MKLLEISSYRLVPGDDIKQILYAFDLFRSGHYYPRSLDQDLRDPENIRAMNLRSVQRAARELEHRINQLSRHGRRLTAEEVKMLNSVASVGLAGAKLVTRTIRAVIDNPFVGTNRSLRSKNSLYTLYIFRDFLKRHPSDYPSEIWIRLLAEYMPWVTGAVRKIQKLWPQGQDIGPDLLQLLDDFTGSAEYQQLVAERRASGNSTELYRREQAFIDRVLADNMGDDRAN